VAGEPLIGGEAGGGRALLARWTLAATVVIAVHAAGAWALVTQAPPAEPQGTPQAPVLIELAPPAAAPEVAALEEAEPAPEPVDAPADEPTPAEPPEPETPAEPTPPEAPPEPVVPPEPEIPEPEQPDAVVPEPEPEAPELPEPEVVEPEPEEPEPELATITNVPLPTARPTPPPRPVREAARQERTREKPRQEKAEPAPQKKKAAAPLRRSPAPSTASQGQRRQQASQGAQVSRAALANWQSQVQARLNRNKRTPRGSGSGTVRVAFAMDANGRVASVRVAGSSGVPTLDQAAVALVQRASPFPAPPSGRQVSLTVPVAFR
jgi:protein TonB